MTVQHPTWSMPVGDNGAELIMMPCPGTKEVDLGSTISQLKGQGVAAILSMMTKDEMAAADVADLPERCKQNNIQWFNMETDDNKVPGDVALAEWGKYKSNLLDVIHDGGVVAIHCMGGTGRTGVGIGMLLLELGWKADQAVDDVKALKPGAFKNELTVAFIKDRAEALKDKT